MPSTEHLFEHEGICFSPTPALRAGRQRSVFVFSVLKSACDLWIASVLGVSSRGKACAASSSPMVRMRRLLCEPCEVKVSVTGMLLSHPARGRELTMASRSGAEFDAIFN